MDQGDEEGERPGEEGNGCGGGGREMRESVCGGGFESSMMAHGDGSRAKQHEILYLTKVHTLHNQRWK